MYFATSQLWDPVFYVDFRFIEAFNSNTEYLGFVFKHLSDENKFI